MLFRLQHVARSVGLPGDHTQPWICMNARIHLATMPLCIHSPGWHSRSMELYFGTAYRAQ